MEIIEFQRKMTECEGKLIGKTEYFFWACPNETLSTRNYHTIPAPPSYRRGNQWNGLKESQQYKTVITSH